MVAYSIADYQKSIRIIQGGNLVLAFEVTAHGQEPFESKTLVICYIYLLFNTLTLGYNKWMII